MRFFTKKFLGFGLFSAAAAAATAVTMQPSEYSQYRNVMERMGVDGQTIKVEGVSKKEQQEAWLKIFYYSGYFNDKELWQAICALKLDKQEQVFFYLKHKLQACQVYDGDPKKVDFTCMADKAFNSGIVGKLTGVGLSETDISDMFLYLAQNAFNRKQNQERNEISDNISVQRYPAEYMEAAKAIGVVDRVKREEQVDEVWIMGAARLGLETRIVDFKYNLANGLTFKEDQVVRLLAGQRKLWAEIDGISPSVQKVFKLAQTQIVDLDGHVFSSGVKVTEEGKQFILALADKKGVPYSQIQPFVQYERGEREGYFPGRHYLNVTTTRELMETDLAKHVLEKYISGVKVVDTLADGEKRPDTTSTVVDALKSETPEYWQGKTVAVQSHQPYAHRQALSAVNAANKLGIEGVKFVPMGPSNKQSMQVLNSESGAFATEMYRLAGFESAREMRDLLFQTRQVEDCNTPPNEGSNGWVKMLGEMIANCDS